MYNKVTVVEINEGPEFPTKKQSITGEEPLKEPQRWCSLPQGYMNTTSGYNWCEQPERQIADCVYFLSLKRPHAVRSTTGTDCAINPMRKTSLRSCVSCILSWTCVCRLQHVLLLLLCLIAGCLSTEVWRWKTSNATALTWTTPWQVCVDSAGHRVEVMNLNSAVLNSLF